MDQRLDLLDMRLSDIDARLLELMDAVAVVQCMLASMSNNDDSRYAKSSGSTYGDSDGDSSMEVTARQTQVGNG